MSTDLDDQLAEYRLWLEVNRDNPELIAGCLRLGRLLGGAA